MPPEDTGGAASVVDVEVEVAGTDELTVFVVGGCVTPGVVAAACVGSEPVLMTAVEGDVDGVESVATR